jgi:hypothetical protein
MKPGGSRVLPGRINLFIKKQVCASIANGILLILRDVISKTTLHNLNTQEKNMSKGVERKKETKKLPTKTLKEKRAEKKSRKQARR